MKYTIIHVNDRAKEQMDHNKKILKDFEYVDHIEFFNGNRGNAWDVINHMGIRQDTWNPYDGRSFSPLPGELGIWVSTIRVWQYMIDNKIDKLLVLEDDIELQNDFLKNINMALEELPNEFDFLSLYYFKDQNWVSEETEFGAANIHKSYNQYSAGQAILYSYSGAKKLLKSVMRKGIEYTTDCFIFRQSLERAVGGYSIKNNNTFFLKHQYKNIQSLIDPEGVRLTDVL
jgi:GR25 family glycosyltransferase involved in LPS biosynthesis